MADGSEIQVIKFDWVTACVEIRVAIFREILNILITMISFLIYIPLFAFIASGVFSFNSTIASSKVPIKVIEVGYFSYGNHNYNDYTCYIEWPKETTQGRANEITQPNPHGNCYAESSLPQDCHKDRKMECTRQALNWNPRVKRSRGRSCLTWKKTLKAELKTSSMT